MWKRVIIKQCQGNYHCDLWPDPVRFALLLKIIIDFEFILILIFFFMTHLDCFYSCLLIVFFWKVLRFALLFVIKTTVDTIHATQDAASNAKCVSVCFWGSNSSLGFTSTDCIMRTSQLKDKKKKEKEEEDRFYVHPKYYRLMYERHYLCYFSLLQFRNTSPTFSEFLFNLLNLFS